MRILEKRSVVLALAGNTLNRPFEVDLLERAEERVEMDRLSLPFEIR